jgi:small subunit ribosomal protein S16
VVKIRLRRVGAKKQPSYRLVVADSRAPQSGRSLETIGFYNPLTEPATIKIDEAKALEWLQKGAQPTDTAARLLTQAGVLEKFAQLKGQSPQPKET